MFVLGQIVVVVLVTCGRCLGLAFPVRTSDIAERLRECRAHREKYERCDHPVHAFHVSILSQARDLSRAWLLDLKNLSLQLSRRSESCRCCDPTVKLHLQCHLLIAGPSPSRD